SFLGKIFCVSSVILSVFRQTEKIKLYINLVIFAKAVLPNAENSVGIIYKGIISQNLSVLIHRIYIEKEISSHIHKKGNPVKGFLNLVLFCKMVYAVQSTYAGVNCAVKVN